MAASETTVASKATAMSSAEAATMSTTEPAAVSSSMLRPHGHGQEKRERRDGCQAAHTGVIISPIGKKQASEVCQELVKIFGPRFGQNRRRGGNSRIDSIAQMERQKTR